MNMMRHLNFDRSKKIKPLRINQSNEDKILNLFLLNKAIGFEIYKKKSKMFKNSIHF